MKGKTIKEYLNKILPDEADVFITGEPHEDKFPHGTIEEIVCQYSGIGFNLFLDFVRKEDNPLTDEATYKIVRKYKDDNHPDHNKVIAEGLTRAEAQAHCKDPESKEDGVWFDCFYEE